MCIIRKCEVVQEVMPIVEAPQAKTITVHDGNGNSPKQLTREDYEALKASGMLWEFHPDAPERWPENTGPQVAECDWL